MEKVIQKITAIWIDDIPPPKKQATIKTKGNTTEEPIQDIVDEEITPPS